MLIFVPLLPLVAGLVIALLHNRLTARAAARIAVAGAVAALLAAVAAARPFVAGPAGGGPTPLLDAWLAAGSINLSGGLRLRPWSAAAVPVLAVLLLLAHGRMASWARRLPPREAVGLQAVVSLVGACGLLLMMAEGLPMHIAGWQGMVLAVCLLATSPSADRSRVGAARMTGTRWAREAWHTVDEVILDGIVRVIAQIVLGWSAILRRAQTGSVRAYAAALVAGVVAILGYYLWRG